MEMVMVMMMNLTLEPLNEHVILYNPCLELLVSAFSLIFTASITSPPTIHVPSHLDILLSMRKRSYSPARNGHRVLCLDLKAPKFIEVIKSTAQ